MPPGHNLQSLPWTLEEGGCHLHDIISRPSNYAVENGYFKILIGCAWGSGGPGRGVALKSLSTVKKGPISSNFQSNEPLLKFIRQLLWYEVPCSKNNNNNKLCPCRSYVYKLLMNTVYFLINLIFFNQPLFFNQENNNYFNWILCNIVFTTNKLCFSAHSWTSLRAGIFDRFTGVFSFEI